MRHGREPRSRELLGVYRVIVSKGHSTACKASHLASWNARIHKLLIVIRIHDIEAWWERDRLAGVRRHRAMRGIIRHVLLVQHALTSRVGLGWVGATVVETLLGVAGLAGICARPNAQWRASDLVLIAMVDALVLIGLNVVAMRQTLIVRVRVQRLGCGG